MVLVPTTEIILLLEKSIEPVLKNNMGASIQLCKFFG
jgi:hypothetical protein